MQTVSLARRTVLLLFLLVVGLSALVDARSAESNPPTPAKAESAEAEPAQSEPAKAAIASPPDEIAPPKFLAAWGSKGTGDGQFEAAIGIAINAADDVFITDASNRRLQRFSRDGKYLDQAPTGNFAGGVAIDSDGLIYVAAMMDHKIQVFRHRPAALAAADRTTVPAADSAKSAPTAAGAKDGKEDKQASPYELVREWGKKGTADGEFDQPGGLAFGSDGTLYVCDQVNHRVQRFSKEGKFLAKWGEYGDANGQFGKPEATYSRVGGPCFAAIDRDGNLYTTEPRPGRIQKFSPEGKWLASWGSNEVRNGAFGGGKNLQGPIAMVFDRQNRVWVSATNHRVQLFTAAGHYLTGMGTLSTPSDTAGQFHTPHAMAINSQGVLYVVDTLNKRVQLFACERP
ncbi:MAG TPA: hypothetical protein VGJ26_04065 [Pirellulales bacterium]|jgi:sugar lactone lactonase YvrE